ncbi:MAG TPA: PAS domain-containing sensor histidine kinase [Chitinophagaceae bacterium]|nr:PAS domain-containing sensor histidine kinase [Chitinophagaceae bacterium]HAN39648.1 PAS domain-containing sensor histidine kinase [Chitinophagaceae bacterium]
MVASKSELFETMFNHASIGIVVADERGHIDTINPFALQQFGYSDAAGLLGQPIEVLIPQRFRHNHKNHHQGYMQRPASRPMGIGLDLYAVRSDGTEFPVEISLGHYRINDRNFVLAFITDVTQRKAAEKALLDLNAALEQKVKERTKILESTVTQLNNQIYENQIKDKELRESLEKEKELSELKSRFVTMASHEFRTPLSTVLSSTYLLSKYTTTEDNAKREKHIQRIISSVNLLNDILNDFLSVGKIEEGKIQVKNTSFELQDFAQKTIAEMRMVTQPQQKIVYRHIGPSDVCLDANLLKHILHNLLSNAIKFSPNHGIIEVFTQVENDTLTLRVSDNGIGISKEDMKHLFERFFRATNAANVQGTGLGLHIVMKYVELMNGRISCHSELEQGTSFVIQVPSKQ